MHSPLETEKITNLYLANDCSQNISYLQALAYEVPESTPPKWECSVGREEGGAGTRHLMGDIKE